MAILIAEGEVRNSTSKTIYELSATNKGFRLTTKEMNPLILCPDTVKVFTTTKEYSALFRRKDIPVEIIEDIKIKIKELRNF